MHIFSQDKFLFKSGDEVYDDFYANIYDYLVFNNLKDDYEIGQITNKTTPTSKSVILDVGSGTGHHVDKLSQQDLEVVGIDISPSMVKKAKENYHSDYAGNFEVHNLENYLMAEQVDHWYKSTWIAERVLSEIPN